MEKYEIYHVNFSKKQTTKNWEQTGTTIVTAKTHSNFSSEESNIGRWMELTWNDLEQEV